MIEDRGDRLQIMLSGDELKALDDWRFAKRMPSRAAAIRELLRRGLAAEGFDFASAGTKSESFGVLAGPQPDAAAGNAVPFDGAGSKAQADGKGSRRA